MDENRTDNEEAESVSRKLLSDEEIALLMGDEIDPGRRRELLSRLGNDPEAMDVLAMSAVDTDDMAEGFDDETVDSLMDIVHDRLKIENICPHCAGEISVDGSFCSHCGALIEGNPLTCFKCSKPVWEGSAYCPHCGAIFKSVKKESFLDSPLFLLILALASFVAAFFSKQPLFIFFIAFGCLLLGSWLGGVLSGRVVSKKSSAVKLESKPDSRDRKISGRKSG
ncbi:MAG: zinc ribbon domain-containing protein [bacterium]